MKKFLVAYYETADGVCPAENFIKGQDIKMRAKIYRMLELLEERGNTLRMPYSEHLEDGIFEVRTQVGRLQYYPCPILLLCRWENHSNQRICEENSENSAGCY